MVSFFQLSFQFNKQVTFVLYDCRKVELTDLESWLEAEKHYERLRLYNVIYMNWIKFMVVPSIFSWCVGIPFLLYVTCRSTGLPFLVYGWFPEVAGVSMTVITWLCYDVVVAKRGVDEVKEKLQSRTAPYFQRLTLLEIVLVMRRVGALQPVYLAMGEFAEVYLDVPVNIRDEVINHQLLFLLSL